MGARILVVGGGYIGMYAARHLERRLRGTAHELVFVNPDNFMLYQPFLPEVASGLIDPRAVVVPLRRVLRRTELVVGEVERSITRHETATVRLGGGGRREIEYDIVILGRRLLVADAAGPRARRARGRVQGPRRRRSGFATACCPNSIARRS